MRISFSAKLCQTRSRDGKNRLRSAVKRLLANEHVHLPAISD